MFFLKKNFQLLKIFSSSPPNQNFGCILFWDMTVTADF